MHMQVYEKTLGTSWKHKALRNAVFGYGECSFQFQKNKAS